jgi:hypothetical protein
MEKVNLVLAAFLSLAFACSSESNGTPGGQAGASPDSGSPPEAGVPLSPGKLAVVRLDAKPMSLGLSKESGRSSGTQVFPSPALPPTDGKWSLLDGELDASADAADGNPSFDLGDLKATDDFLFILKNVGGAAIKDVTLTSSDPAFQVSPSTISLLEPSATAGIEPVVRLRILHGQLLGGVGYAPLMSPGAHAGQVTIQGQTTDGQGKGQQTSLQFSASVHAQVMDLKAYVGATAVDFLSCPRQQGYPSCQIQGAPLDLKLENAGNVDIDLTWLTMDFITSKATETLAVGASTPSTVEKAANYLPEVPRAFYAIRLWGQGAVSDPQRLPLQPDGNVFILFDIIP